MTKAQWYVSASCAGFVIGLLIAWGWAVGHAEAKVVTVPDVLQVVESKVVGNLYLYKVIDNNNGAVCYVTDRSNGGAGVDCLGN